ncbi:MAG: S8 family peptidase, partial [Candidatus Hodarchaeales archaeon]
MGRSSKSVHNNDRMPDLPEWVEVQKAFTIIPAIQVSCKLGDLPNLADLRYVDAMIPAGGGVLAKLSSFNQNSNPYLGDFPLLLNETATLVEAEDNNTNGDGVIIAILSTGINENHPMLDDQDDDWSSNNNSKVLDSYDAYEDAIGPGGDETDDNNGRGTALASIVAGTGACGGRLNGSIDLSYPYPHEANPTYETLELDQTFNIGTQQGLAPGASLFDIKITNDIGDDYEDGAAIAGIEWAVDHGADVILLDDLNSVNPLVISVIEIATSRGALVIVPSGDFIPPGGYDDDYIAPYYTINSPASAPTALTVGATTETDSMWL